MTNYKVCKQAKEDLIRNYQYDARTFGNEQTDQYLFDFFDQFEIIACYPERYQKADFIPSGYCQCVCGVERNIFYGCLA
jgi:toxin ParE1/3/4